MRYRAIACHLASASILALICTAVTRQPASVVLQHTLIRIACHPEDISARLLECTVEKSLAYLLASAY
jgi:hypothetical protein